VAPIPPHDKILVSGNKVHYPRTLVHRAQDFAAAHMQMQFGITGVFFEDGTTWPDPLDLHNRSEPFDRSLADEDGKCGDLASAASALQSVREVVFGSELADPSGGDNDASGPPHIRFSCTLEGSQAICHMPVEGGRDARAAIP
jgi:hypothetical protein